MRNAGLASRGVMSELCGCVRKLRCVRLAHDSLAFIIAWVISYASIAML